MNALRNHTTTDHKEGEQLEDRRTVGASSCNFGDGTDQRVQSLMFMMIMMMMIYCWIGPENHRTVIGVSFVIHVISYDSSFLSYLAVFLV